MPQCHDRCYVQPCSLCSICSRALPPAWMFAARCNQHSPPAQARGDELRATYMLEALPLFLEVRPEGEGIPGSMHD